MDGMSTKKLLLTLQITLVKLFCTGPSNLFQEKKHGKNGVLLSTSTSVTPIYDFATPLETGFPLKSALNNGSPLLTLLPEPTTYITTTIFGESATPAHVPNTDSTTTVTRLTNFLLI